MAEPIIERLIKRILGGDLKAFDSLCSHLADRIIYVPTVAKNSTKEKNKIIVQIYKISKRNKEVVPIFTTEKYFKTWAALQDEKLDTLDICGGDICISLGNSTSVIIDPQTSHELELSPEQVEAIAKSGMIEGDSEVIEDDNQEGGEIFEQPNLEEAKLGSSEDFENMRNDFSFDDAEDFSSNSDEQNLDDLYNYDDSPDRRRLEDELEQDLEQQESNQTTNAVGSEAVNTLDDDVDDSKINVGSANKGKKDTGINQDNLNEQLVRSRNSDFITADLVKKIRNFDDTKENSVDRTIVVMPPSKQELAKLAQITASPNEKAKVPLPLKEKKKSSWFDLFRRKK